MISRLRVSRFRSLGKDVTVEFGPLTVLVGKNGAGKSNTIDALVFLSDCMQLGLEGAVSKRAGMKAVRHAGTQGRPFDVSLGVDVELPNYTASYDVCLTGDSSEDYRVKREHAKICDHGTELTLLVEGGNWLEGPRDVRPAVNAASLALTLLSGDARFAPLAQALKGTSSYSIFPDELRKLHAFDAKRPMDRYGANWVSILKTQEPSSWKPDLIAVLNKLTGDIQDIKFEQASGYLVATFKHERDPAAKRKQWFDAGQESDGTLRVAGMMTALLQKPRPESIAIEEPELTVHPGAIRLLYEYIKESSLGGQVVLTTHSPDLLSMLAADEVRVVTRHGDETLVAPLDESQRDVVTRGLFSLGDIMRSEGLRPKPQDVESNLGQAALAYPPEAAP